MPARQFISKHFDQVLALVLGILYVVEILTESGFAGDRPASLALALPFSAALVVRRRTPLLPLILSMLIIEGSNLFAPALAETGAFLFGVIITVYSAGAYSSGRTTLVAGALVAIAIPFAAIEPGQTVSASDFAFFIVFFGGPFAAGRIMRSRRARERTLEGRAVQLQREGDARAREAVAEERARIARELHDVVTHALSVIVLHARGARRSLNADSAELREPLDTIEHSGRQAMDEMRRLLGVLRDTHEEPALSPRPSLNRLDEMLEGVRAAGLQVDLELDGDLEELPPGLDVSAYRIVQEALTNALKHAGPARARLVIRRTPAELEIEVADDGQGEANGDGGGYGLAGMRERVAVYGGELQAGNRTEGGYVLNARLPLAFES